MPPSSSRATPDLELTMLEFYLFSFAWVRPLSYSRPHPPLKNRGIGTGEDWRTVATLLWQSQGGVGWQDKCLLVETELCLRSSEASWARAMRSSRAEGLAFARYGIFPAVNSR